MKFKCHKHPDEDANLISGYSTCPACSRKNERDILIKWCQHVKPEFTKGHILRVLEEMFNTPDFGFSTFLALYPRFPRAIKKDKKNNFIFVLPQEIYLQKSFLLFLKGGKNGIKN